MSDCPKCGVSCKSIIEEFNSCSKCVPSLQLKKWILGEWYDIFKDCSVEEKRGIFRKLIIQSFEKKLKEKDICTN